MIKIKKPKQYRLHPLFDAVEMENNISELISTWGAIGLISEDVNKRNMALAFELVFKYLHSEQFYGDMFLNLKGCFYPTVYRIFRTIKADLPVGLIFDMIVDIANELNKFTIVNQGTITELRMVMNNTIDIEAEMIANFCDEYIRTNLTPNYTWQY